MINYKHQQSGFSLVETLVAITLLLLVIVGPMAISSQTAKSSTFASEQVQAFFLAQEGLELAQKARDDMRLDEFKGDIADGWGEFVNSSGAYGDCFSSNGCGLEWGSTPGEVVVNNCSGDSCRLYRSTGGRSWFTYDSSGGNVQTPFTREIYFETNTTNAPDSDREVYVHSVVTWRTGSFAADQIVEVDTYLYAEGRN